MKIFIGACHDRYDENEQLYQLMDYVEILAFHCVLHIGRRITLCQFPQAHDIFSCFDDSSVSGLKVKA
jgi:hypothetical protein